jgi:lipoate-protein ligase A
MLETPPGFFQGDGMATLRMAVGEVIELHKVKSFIIQAFEKTFDVSFEKFDKNPLKKKLLLKYSSIDWNFRGKI